MVWSITREPWAIAVALASGVLVDVDYLIYISNYTLKILHA